MAERIDGFAHALPREFIDEFADTHNSEELAALNDAPRFWEMDIRLEMMDRYGIDRQVITLARPPIWQGLDPADALEMVELANDGIAELAEDHDELVPVATIPYGGAEYASEFERCIDDLGMAGVQLWSNVEGEPIDVAYDGLFGRIADREVPVWLHPQLHEWHEWDEDYMLHKMLGWPFDTSLALSRLVFSGVLDRHPDLTVIGHHMGAMIPHFTSRLESFQRMLAQHRDVYPYKVPDLESDDVEGYFRSFYGDTCRSGNPDILEDGHEFFGGDRLVFATDYPFGPEKGEGFVREEIESVDAMDVTAAERDAIYGSNLDSLL